MICPRCAKEKNGIHTCTPSEFVRELEAQVAALTQERDEYSNELKHGALPSLLQLQDQLAAAQAVNEKLREGLERREREAYNMMADRGWTNRREFIPSELLALPTDTTALQARLAEEREKVITKIINMGWTHSADVAAVIRSMT